MKYSKNMKFLLWLFTATKKTPAEVVRKTDRLLGGSAGCNVGVSSRGQV